MITVIGSSNIDYITHGFRIPNKGETVFADNFMTTSGGKGANQAVAAARLGADVTLLTMLGKQDRYINLLTDGFTWAGVDYSRTGTKEDDHCGCALIMVDGQGQNIITIVSNANSAITPEYIAGEEEILKKSDLVLIEFGIPMETAVYGAEVAVRYGARVIVTPAPVQPIPDELYAHTSILVPSKTEASELSGIDIVDGQSASAAAAFLHNKGVNDVIITLGEEGALISSLSVLGCEVYDSNSGDIRPLTRQVGAHAVSAVDTAGAGDSFTGALASSLDRGKGLLESVEFAQAAAALCVTKPGTTRAMACLDEVDDFLKERKHT